MNQKGQGSLELLFAGGAVVAFLGFFLVAASIHLGAPSEGQRVGQVTKFSAKGLIWTTHEGELSMGSAGVNVFKFSVDKDQALVSDQITVALEHGSQVRLYYRQPFFAWRTNGDTRTYVWKVELVR